MKLSTKSRYATRILILMAGQPGEVSFRKVDIAKGEGIPPDYVAQILLTLKRAGLVNSQRGAQGGFTLAKDPETITILDVIEATEGPVSLVDCANRASPCKRSGVCVTKTIWEGAGKLLRDYFNGITIGELADRVRKTKKHESPSFQI